MMINVVNPSQSQNFSGLVLLSNPQNQIDTEFEKCVIAVVQHQRDKGAMGLILNRPLRLMLNDFDANQWEHFDDVPVFKGGPVEQKRLILTAIDWTPNNHFLKWHLGLQARQASQLLSQNESIVLRAYCGYVGWREGQLEEELDKKIWLPVPMNPQEVFASDNKQLWNQMILKFHPGNLMISQLPFNPSFN